MDTKLKKSSKLAKLIIGLAVLLPAIILVSLYPRMEKLMLEKQSGYQENLTTNSTETEPVDQYYENYSSISVRQDLVNYAMEAAYYLYGRLLQEERNKAVDFSVLDAHGWINDYYTVNGETMYYVSYETAGSEIIESNITNTSLAKEMDASNFVFSKEDMDWLSHGYGIVCVLFMEFDEYGMISNIGFEGVDGVDYTANLYETARNSVKQYRQNATYYNSVNPKNMVDVEEMVPKKFKAVFLIHKDSMFLNEFSINLDSYVQYLNNPEQIYVNIGAPIVVLICMVVVALVALVLPFFKRLNTGWELLFCLPFEMICGLVVAFVAGVYLMFIGMCHVTMTEIGQSIGSVEILGYILEKDTIYGLLLGVSVIGWALCFFVEYTIVAHCRQFLCGPIYYFKHRILIVRFIGWIGKQIKRLYHYIVDIDIDKGLHGSIVKIVLANLVLVGACCCLWFVGIAGVVIYSLVLYVILRKQGKKLQEQYGSIVYATKQMADGELKISLNKDLGVFAPLGAELEKVQEGFSKAVAEEAKSQSMKTELISNVSHDLKTPLTAIITYVNLLKQEGISEADKKNYIQTLDMKSQRLKALIEDLFEVSKAQSGNIQLNYMDVDVVNIMKQLRLEMEDKLADSDLHVRWNLPEEKVILHLDGQKTYRVFENLLSNALKYAMRGSRVYVDIINSETEVEIVFKNISAVELSGEADRLTDRFVRGDSARTTEGSGLGLAIVKSFVELQGGSFKIDIDGDLFKAIILWKK
ncbi:MAG: HAMP domain-containing histidine kinase [Lachnospiraceae bacterium]|nr:HAMP domain-containing histidine kinase [Lachnospiraceae bacterium]